MRCYEVRDERNRICNYKWTDEKPCGEVIQTHTYSSAYFNMVMSEEWETARKIVSGESELEYIVK